ncbi:MAG: GNAT family N-acetyltransferase [Acidimicrobiales bacterium]
MTLVVREGCPDDDALLAGHTAAGASEQAAHRGRRDAQPHPERLVVGEIDGVACATLGWVRAGDSVRIVHVYVEPWAREVGMGDAMMAALLEYAAHEHVERVGGSALPGDRSMKNLFERNGLVAREILVERRLR